MAINNEELANKLTKIASTMQNAPINITVVGFNVTAMGDGSRTVIGHQSIAIASPGSTGVTIGTNVVTTVDTSIVSGLGYEKEQLLDELKNAAKEAKDGNVNKGWLTSILKRVRSWGEKVENALLMEMARELMHQLGIA